RSLCYWSSGVGSSDLRYPHHRIRGGERRSVCRPATDPLQPRQSFRPPPEHSCLCDPPISKALALREGRFPASPKRLPPVAHCEKSKRLFGKRQKQRRFRSHTEGLRQCEEVRR